MSRAGRCRYCEETHKPRWLCDPAKRVLDAMYAKGMEFNMPDLVFPESAPAEEILARMGADPGDVVLRQLMVQAATVPVAGTHRPALIFTGQGIDGTPLPRWLHIGDSQDMQRTVDLAGRMAQLAVDRARAKNEGRTS